MPNHMNAWIKTKMQQLREGSKCVMCGTNQDIEFAHKNPTKLSGKGRGRKERYYDILNNPDCYIPLCKQHHKEYDNEKAKRRRNEEKN